MSFAPSKYQQDIFDWIDLQLAKKRTSTANLVVKAGPGSGKTTTLVQAAQRLPASMHKNAIFVAFNKHIAEELKSRLPCGMQAKTLHSAGMGSVIKWIQDKNPSWKPNFDSWIDGGWHRKLAQDWLMEHNDKLQLNSEEWRETADAIVKLIDACQLTMTDPHDADRVWKLIDWYGLDDVALNAEIAISALPEIFNRIITEAHKTISFSEMIWLPVSQKLRIRQYDLVMADESQDFNRCQRWLVKKMTKRNGITVWVGDKHQCQPAGTMIRMADHTLKPIEEVQLGDKVLSYHRKNGYYKTGIVSGTASRSYFGQMYSVTAGGKTTQATENHKWLVRWTNMEDEKHVVYLMRNRCGQYRIGHCQLFTQSNGSRKRGRDLGLGNRVRGEDAEAGWILKVCDTSIEAFQLEQILSAQYGLPQIRFTARGAEKMTQANINYIHDQIDSETGALKLLRNYGMDHRYPLVDRSEYQQRRGGATHFVTQSCNLLSGYMEIPVPPEELKYKPRRSYADDWQTITIERQQANTTVYSLEIDQTHLYVADGLLTHNSIYGFAFASTQSIDEIIHETNSDVLPLSICYRCPASHVALANQLIDTGLEPRPGAPEGEITNIYDFQVADHIERGDLVVCRVNAPLVPLCFTLIRQGIGARIKGRDIGKNLIQLVEKIEKQRNDGINWRLPHDNLREWANGEAQLIFLRMKDDEAASMAISTLNDKIQTLIAIWEGNKPTNTAGMIREIEALFADESAAVWLSTIHKAKGLEAENVYILAPSQMPHPMARKPWEREQETNMEYIAATRAKARLIYAWAEDEPGCPPIDCDPGTSQPAEPATLEEIVERELITATGSRKKQLDKLKKLLSLANDPGNNANEANSARAKAIAMAVEMGLIDEPTTEPAPSDREPLVLPGRAA